MDTPAPLTLQQIFDRTAQHLLTQGCQSLSTSPIPGRSEPRCLYRGPNGNKCAAGLWIADEHYHPDMEGKTVYNSSIMDALEKSGFGGGHDTRLLSMLQLAHDGEGPVPVMGNALRKDFDTGIRINLRHVAREFDLSAAVLDAGVVL